MKTKKTIKTAWIVIICLAVLLVTGAGHAAPPERTYSKVMLIVFDGARYGTFTELLDGGYLPNIDQLRTEGGMAQLMITSHMTMTDASYATLLTGYGGSITTVTTNAFQVVPEGYTIFERLKALRPNFRTVFIAGKHSDKDPQGYGVPEYRDHGFPNITFQNAVNTDDLNAFIDPYYSYNDMHWGPYSSGFSYPEDYYELENAEYNYVNSGAVTDKVVEQIDKIRDRNFFMTVAYAHPDLSGHMEGEGSVEYRNTILRLDNQIGRIISSLRDEDNGGAGDIYDDTAIIVASDHGFVDDGVLHFSYGINSWLDPTDPDCYTTWMISNSFSLPADPVTVGIQVDMAATIYGLLDVDTTGYHLRDGKGLAAKPIWER